MGKGFVSHKHSRHAKEKHKNISKKVADKQAKVKEFNRSKLKEAKVMEKKQDFEL